MSLSQEDYQATAPTFSQYIDSKDVEKDLKKEVEEVEEGKPEFTEEETKLMYEELKKREKSDVSFAQKFNVSIRRAVELRNEFEQLEIKINQ